MSVTVDNRRIRLRSAVAAVLALLLLVPVGILFTFMWNGSSYDRDTVTLEQRGVEYLAALGPLITIMAEAQSAAIAGASPPAALPGAVATIAATDQRLGSTLRTTERWTDLRGRIEALRSASGGPIGVYQAHVEVTELLLALFNTVRNNSLLVRDPDRDVSHLQQATAADLPEAVIHATRMADLSLLVRDAPASERRGLDVQFGAAIAAVDSAVDRLTDNLQAAASETDSRTLSSSMISTLDDFRAGIETLTRGANPGGEPNPQVLATARAQMQQTLFGISTTIGKEVIGLLQRRLDTIDADRRRALLVVGGAVVLTLLTLYAILGSPSGRRGRTAGAATAGTGAAHGDSRHDPSPHADEATSTRRERSGALR